MKCKERNKTKTKYVCMYSVVEGIIINLLKCIHLLFLMIFVSLKFLKKMKWRSTAHKFSQQDEVMAEARI